MADVAHPAIDPPERVLVVLQMRPSCPRCHRVVAGFPAPGDPRRGTREGCLMSNIVPQQRKGHVRWGKLENEHRHVVADASKGIKVVWLISGPVFLNGQAEKVIGPDRVGAPHVVYKVIGWQKADGGSWLGP